MIEKLNSLYYVLMSSWEIVYDENSYLFHTIVSINNNTVGNFLIFEITQLSAWTHQLKFFAHSFFSFIFRRNNVKTFIKKVYIQYWYI